MPSNETPPSDESDFEEIFEDQPQNSVYDFIYQDVRRIGSFLAQFDEYGVRQSVKATESTGRTESSKSTASGTIGIPLVAGGSGLFDASVSDETKDVAEYTFDPLWTNARRLLDYLSEHRLLNKDIWETRLGSFVQIEGWLAVIDPGLVKPTLKLNSIKKIVRKNVSSGLSGSENEKNIIFDAFIELIQVIPTSIQAHIAGDDYTAWCTLSEASLSVSSADLALKHGSFIPGQWTLIGILDAFPDRKLDPTSEEPNPKTMDEIVAEFAGTMVGTMTSQLTSVARDVVGRPRNFFGVTPLVIFREVSAGR